MNILVVGNVLKDVYLNLDTRTEKFETDKNGTKWLDVSFDASNHHFFNRESSLGGAAITLEVLEKMGIKTTVTQSDLSFSDEGLTSNTINGAYRYILISDEQVSYLVPSAYKITSFDAPTEAYDYLFIDRSAELDVNATKKISAYLDISPKTKLVVYARDLNNINLNSLTSRADLVFWESDENNQAINIDEKKLIRISDQKLEYLDIHEKVSMERVDILTHLSIYSIAAATILGGFILGKSVEESLKLARLNMENSRLNTVLSLTELQAIIENTSSANDLELVAANLMLKPKGILAADESNESIKRRFEQFDIADTDETRHDYRNLLLTTPDLQKYLNGVILFDETAHQQTDSGQNFVRYLTAKRIVPGIKVDQGLKKLNNSLETCTKGLVGLDQRLKEYFNLGLRFAKWRAVFEIKLNQAGKVITPTDFAIQENCRAMAEYAKKCQSAGLVPIVEPEVMYDGYFSIENNAEVSTRVLTALFEKLREYKVNLEACILKTNMVLAGKYYSETSSAKEIGEATARVLKESVPEDLAGVVFLSGGQTPEQATENLAEIINNRPFPWPVSFSFARAVQEPALLAWQGDNENIEKARQALIERLSKNIEILK